MIVVRFLALVLLVLAILLLGADIAVSFGHGGVAIRSLAQTLLTMNADPTPWVKSLPPSVAGIAGTILEFPSWAVSGLLGILLALVSMRGS